MTRRTFGSGAAAAVAGILAGCGTADAAYPDQRESESGWSGQLVEPGIAMPDVTLLDTQGSPFSLQSRTNGKLAILAFGYTNCPDVCPVYLNTLASAIENTSFSGGRDPMVLFVGVDTKRDTPEVLNTYLDRINPDFVGLTGNDSDIAQANSEVYNPPVQIEEADEDGEYLVFHSGRLLAFTPDGLAHRIYPPDSRQQDWVADLPRLSAGKYE